MALTKRITEIGRTAKRRPWRAALLAATIVLTAVVLASLGAGGSIAAHICGQPLATKTWDSGGTTANWNEAANWSGDTLPTASDYVCIPDDPSITTTVLNATFTIQALESVEPLTIAANTLTLSDANTDSELSTLNLGGSGNLYGSSDRTISTELNWTGGELNGASTTTIPAAAVFKMAGGTKYLTGSHQLHNNSTTTTDWRGGELYIYGTTVGTTPTRFNNGGTIRLVDDPATLTTNEGDVGINHSGNTVPAEFNNNGALVKVNGGAGGSDYTYVSVPFNNSGSGVQVNQGRMRFAGGGTHGSPFTVATAGRLQFEGGTHILGGSVTGGAALPTPTGVTATGSTGTGALTPGTYFYKVTALNVNGETTGSTEASATLAATGKVSLAWGAVAGAASYRVYRGTATNAQNVYYTTTAASLEDTGTAATGGGVPGTNTTASTVSFAGGATTLNGPYDVPTTSISSGTHTFAGATTLGTLGISGGTGRFDVATSPSTFNMSGGDRGGSGTMTVGDRFNWTAGELRDAGVTTAGAGSTFRMSGSTKYLTNGHVFNNNSTSPTDWVGGDLYVYATTPVGAPVTTFNNNGTIRLVDDPATPTTNEGDTGDLHHSGNTVPAVFNNTGTLTKVNGDPTGAAENTYVSVPFNNAGGSVHVNQGMLRLAGGGNHTGPFTVGQNSFLRFEGGTHNLASPGATVTKQTGVTVATGQFTGGTTNLNASYDLPSTGVSGGTHTFAGTTTLGSLSVSGGTGRFNTATTPANVAVSGGDLGGTSSMTIGSAFTWNGGELRDNGTTTVASTATLAMGGSTKYLTNGRVFNNNSASAADWVGGDLYVYATTPAGAPITTFNNNGTIRWVDNPATTTTNEGDTGDIHHSGNTVPAEVNNNGTFRKVDGDPTGASENTYISVPFENDGASLIVDEGRVRLAGGSGGSSSGSDGVSAGSFSAAAGTFLDFEGGTHNLGSTSSVTGDGTLRQLGGVTNMNGDWNVAGTTGVSGGTLNLEGSGSGANHSTSTLLLSGGALGGAGIFDVATLMRWTGGTMEDIGFTSILAGALVELDGTSHRYLDSGRTLYNAGTARWMGTGGMTVGGGTPSGGTFFNAEGALFEIESNETMSSGVGGAFQNQGIVRKRTPATGGWVSNYGAEASAGAANATTDAGAPTDWARGGVGGPGKFTAVQYGATGGFPPVAQGNAIGGGANFFAGGPSDSATSTTGTQTVALSGEAHTAADAGELRVFLDGYLGGKTTETDNAKVDATFLNSSNAVIGTPLTIGPVTAAQRANTTQLLYREGSVVAPVGTRSIRLVITATRAAGPPAYNDGYADKIRLRVKDAEAVLGTTVINVPLDNDVGAGLTGGVVEAVEGTLTFNGGSVSSGGTPDASTGSFNPFGPVNPTLPASTHGGEIGFGGGTFELASSGGITGLGAARFTAGTTHAHGAYDVNRTAITSGTLNLDSPDAKTVSASQSSGRLGGPGTLTVSGAMSWTGGEMTGVETSPGVFDGQTVIAPAGSLALSSTSSKNIGAYLTPGRDLIVKGAGTMSGTGDLYVMDQALLRVEGSWNQQSDADMAGYYGSGQVVVPAGGTFTKSAPSTLTDSTRITVPFDNDSTGSVNVTGGRLDLGAGGIDFNSGTFGIASGTALRLSGGTHDFGATSSIAGLGTLETTAGTGNVAGSYALGSTSVSGGALNFNSLTPATTNATFSGGRIGGYGRLTVSGPMSWTGGEMTGVETDPGVFEGETVIAPTATLALSGTSSKNMGAYQIPGRDLIVRGAATMAGTGDLYLMDQALLRVEGSWDQQSDADMAAYYGSGQVVVPAGGTFTKSGPSTLSDSTRISVPFDNDSPASVNVTGGRLDLGGGDIDSNEGRFDVSGGAALRLSGGTQDFGPASSLLGAGLVEVTSGISNVNGLYSPTGTSVSGGSINFTGLTPTTTNLALSNGTIGGPGRLTVTGAGTWTGGVMNAVQTGTSPNTYSGETVIAPGATLALSGTSGKDLGGYLTPGRDLIVKGAATMSNTGPFYVMDQGLVRIEGTWDQQSDADIAGYYGSGSIEVPAGGTLTKSGGDVADSTNISIPLTNQGTIVAQAQNLLSTSAFTNGGTLDVRSGARFTSQNNNEFTNWNSGTKRLTGGAYLIRGAFRFFGADIVNNAANITLDGVPSAVTDTAGTPLNAFRNFAKNDPAGSFTLRNDRDLTTPGAFLNEGTLNLASSNSIFTAGAGGTATLTNAAPTGLVKGVGTVRASGTTNNGTVAPGASPGMLTIDGNYTQSSTGKLEIEVAGTGTPGTQFDVLSVTENATLDGTLAGIALGGFVPALGTGIDVVTAAFRSGTFSTVSSTPSPLAGTVFFQARYEPETVKLFVTPNVSAVDPAAVTEGTGAGSTVVNVPVTLSAPSSEVIQVTYATANGTAAAGSDFAATSGTLTFNPGQPITQNVPVTITRDAVDEPDSETFVVNLSAPVNSIIGDGQAQVSILDDDVPNAGPIADDQSATTPEDTPIPVTLVATDPNGDPITFQVVGNPTNGTLGTLAGNLVTYTPNANFNGSDSFTFKANDGANDSNTATVSITVTPVNDTPSAAADSKTTAEDTPLTFPAGDLTTNDSAGPANESSQTLTVTAVAGPVNGTVSLVAGSITFTPNSNFNGAASFAYTVTDNGLTNGTPDPKTANGVVNVTVTPVNDAPVAQSNTYSLNEDGVLNIDAPGLLGNDLDVDGNPITASKVTDPAHGTVTVNPNGSFSYTPSANYNGPDSFTYKANDGLLDSNVATVTLTVNPVNDTPAANANAYTVAEDGSLTVATPGVLANDTDVDGNPLTAVLGATTASGTLGLNPNGSFTYTPNANFNGTDTFTYKANDGTIDSNLATVTITVTEVNDAPIAVDDGKSAAEDGAITFPASDLLSNDAKGPANESGQTLAVTAVTNAVGGTANLAGGNITFTPAADHNGIGSFEYTVADNGTTNGVADPKSDVGAVTVGITEVNDAPVAATDTKTTAEDSALTFPATDLLGNDLKGPANESAQTLSVISVQGAVNGTVSLLAGQITFTPAANHNGAASFTYTIRDNGTTNGAADPKQATGTVDVTVTPVNDAPVAAADSYSTAENTALTIGAPGLLANDTDIDTAAAALSAIKVTNPGHGTVTVNPNGSFTYTPSAAYSGPDSFTYKANDGALDSNVVTVSIDVGAVNDAPVAQNQGVTTAEDTAKAITLVATDIDSSSLTYAIVSGPAHGALSGTPPNITYTPAANYNGPDSLTFKANDGALDSNVATVSLNVTEVNDDPTAVTDSKTAAEDTPLTFPASDLLANDLKGPANESAQTLTVASVQGPINGTVTLLGGNITFTPSGDYNGPASFSYTITDNGTTNGAADPKSSSGVANVTVSEVNDAPTAVADTKPAAEDTPLTFPAGDLLANDLKGPTNESTQTLTVVSVQGAVNGTASLAAGQITFTPAANLNGPASFTYTIRDNGTTNGTLDAKEATGTVTVNVSEVNDAPSAATDAKTTAEDTPLTFPASDLLVNDSKGPANESGQTLTVISVQGAAAGTVSLVGGNITFTPEANRSGPAGFTYTIRDNGTTSGSLDPKEATGTVNVNVTPVNDAPVANDDGYSTPENTTLTINRTVGVLANDTDVDTSVLSLTAAKVSDPVHGTLTLDPNGSFSYVPNAGYSGPDSFTYKANDVFLDSNVATVSLDVGAVNDAPVADNDAYSVSEDGTLNVAAPGVLDGDTDPDSATLTTVLVAPTTNGVLTLNPNGSFSYSPTANFSGTDTFTYRATDGSLTSNIATVTITVNAVNDPPTAANDAKSTNEDTPLSAALPAATDIDSTVFTYAKLADPTHGSLTMNPNGTYTYTPNANFNGTDTFTYRAHDGSAESNIATVTITVNPVNDAPAAVNDAYTATEDTTLNQNGVLDNDTDIDTPAASLSAIEVTDPANGDVTLNPNGTFTYVPNAHFNGVDTFTYKANDGFLDSNVTTVTITVSEVNDAPAVVNDNKNATEDQELRIPIADVLANDTKGPANESAQTLAVTAVHDLGVETYGDVAIDTATQEIVWTPTEDFRHWNGHGRFEYTITDNGTTNGAADAKTSRGSVILSIKEVNDPPVAAADSKTTDEDQQLVFSAAQLTTNDAPGPVPPHPWGSEAAQSLTVVSVQDAAQGAVSLAGGQITFTPSANYNGPASFTYTVRDDGTSNGVADPKEATGTVNVTVNPINDAPIAANDAKSTNEDTPLAAAVPTATDIDSAAFTYAKVANPSSGTVTMNADGSYTYTPSANYHGTDSFTYTANDGGLDSNVATVTITVNPVNDAPLAQSQSVSTQQNTAKDITLVATDVESGALSYSIEAIPLHGELSGTAPNLTYTPDPGFSGSDSFTFKANDGAADSNVATVTIDVLPNAPALSIDDAQATEGNNGNGGTMTFTVARTGDLTAPVSVQFASSSGTATSGTDFGAVTGTLNFGSGVGTQTFTVKAIGDSVDEPDETLNISLSGATGGATILDGAGVGTVIDDDAAMRILDAQVIEGDPAPGDETVDVDLTVQLTSSSLPASATYSTADGTAKAAKNDYVTKNGTVSFETGETTQTITIAVKRDELYDGQETFFVDLDAPFNSQPADARGVVTIFDEDESAQPSIVVSNPADLGEGAGNATFVVTIDRAAATDITASFATKDGTAKAPADYTARTDSLTIPEGALSTTVVVPINDDTKAENTETFELEAANSNALLGDAVGAVNILDNDPNPSIAINDATVLEGNSGPQNAVFTVSLSAPSGKTVTVPWSTPGTPDVPAQSGTATIAADDSDGADTFAVEVTGDTVDETNETFEVTLGTPVNATAGDLVGVGTILDDDGPQISIGDAQVIEGNSGTTTMTFPITLDAASVQPVSIVATTSNGTATAPGDYTGKSESITIPAGQTGSSFTVTVNGDTAVELNETLTVDLTNPLNGALLVSRGIGTISNDDVPAPTADLALTLSGPSNVIVGRDYTYRGTIANNGPSPATGVVLANTLPDNIKLVSATFGSGQACSGEPVVNCAIGTLASGASVPVVITAKATGGPRTVVDTARVTSPVADPVLANNQATVETDITTPTVRVVEGVRCTIVGTNKGERIRGTKNRDVICALGGNDRIFGLGGNDRILGGKGNDIVDGGAGKDLLEGGDGNDLMTGGKGKDRLVGGNGRDRLLGGPGGDLLNGGPGNDILNGGDSKDILRGGPGNDRLSKKGPDVTVGGGGTDRCIGVVVKICP